VFEVEELKILYFHQHFSPPAGKTGTRSYEMAKAALNKGHEVLMVCGSYDASFTGLKEEFKKGSRRGWVDGIEVLEFRMPYSNDQSLIVRTLIFLKFSFSATMIALTEKYDLIFCTSTPLTIALPGIFSKWIRNEPFVFEVRDLWPELPKAMGVITNPFVIGLMSGLGNSGQRSLTSKTNGLFRIHFEKMPGKAMVRGVEVQNIRSYFSVSAIIVAEKENLRNINVRTIRL
jgi:hypothetical protein